MSLSKDIYSGAHEDFKLSNGLEHLDDSITDEKNIYLYIFSSFLSACSCCSCICMIILMILPPLFIYSMFKTAASSD